MIIFLYLILFVVALFIILLIFAGKIMQLLTGGIRGMFKGPQTTNNNSGAGRTNQRQTDNQQGSRRGKVFGPSEGEYVEYEEVKED